MARKRKCSEGIFLELLFKEDEEEEEEEQEKEAFVAGGDAKNLKELCLQLENLFALDE